VRHILPWSEESVIFEESERLGGKGPGNVRDPFWALSNNTRTDGDGNINGSGNGDGDNAPGWTWNGLVGWLTAGRERVLLAPRRTGWGGARRAWAGGTPGGARSAWAR
jgi:hypothetical protein